MRQPKTVAMVLVAYLIGLYWPALVRELLPPYQATFVLVSETEISDVEVKFEGRPVRPNFFHWEKDRLFVWDNLVARSTSPYLEVAWRGSNGHRHSVGQRMLHEPSEPRCIYMLQLDAAGIPAPLGWRPNSGPLSIDDICR